LEDHDVPNAASRQQCSAQENESFIQISAKITPMIFAGLGDIKHALQVVGLFIVRIHPNQSRSFLLSVGVPSRAVHCESMGFRKINDFGQPQGGCSIQFCRKRERRWMASAFSGNIPEQTVRAQFRLLWSKLQGFCVIFTVTLLVGSSTRLGHGKEICQLNLLILLIGYRYYTRASKTEKS